MSHYDSLSQWNKDLCIAPLLKDGLASSELPTIQMRSLQPLDKHNALLSAGQTALDHRNFRTDFLQLVAGEPTEWILWIVKMTVSRLELRFIHRDDCGDPIKINFLGNQPETHQQEVVVMVNSPIALEVQFEVPALPALSPIRERPATTYSFAMSSSGSTGTHNIRLTEQKAGQSDCSILNLNIPPVG